jgi:hypothetical protein
MNAVSPKQQIEALGAGVFIRNRNSEARLQEENFYRAFGEPVVVWIAPGEFREEKMDALLDAAKKLHAVQRFRFPNVSVSERVLVRIRSEFPNAAIEGVK